MVWFMRTFIAALLCTVSYESLANKTSRKKILIPQGTFTMGCTGCDIEDALPLHKVSLDSFWISETPVTNKEFRVFVKETSYVTTAEKKLDPRDFPGVPVEKLRAGSTVFRKPDIFKGLHNPLSWWEFRYGANWKKPAGSKGGAAKDEYPVVHVSYLDAVQYCKWAGGRLPTEAEFEYAARGGLEGKKYAWGDSKKPEGKWVANIWQGLFPMKNKKEDGYEGLSPVKAFPPNGYKLYDMGGNVWQWVEDWYRPDYYRELKKAGVAKNPKGPTESFDPQEPGVPKKVQKGGSHLCADNYCTRFYVGSRGKGEISTGSGHLSFRCAW